MCYRITLFCLTAVVCFWPLFYTLAHLFTEDEQQQKTLSCSKSVRQLTLERDQALADLNSVERSFADLFRRYENMKGVLEGFKKVSRVSVWITWEAVWATFA